MGLCYSSLNLTIRKTDNMATIEYKLDNPVWNSLIELDERYSMEFNGLKFYNPEYCPFAALIQKNNATEVILETPNVTNNFYVFGEKPLIGNGLTIIQKLCCNQMLLEKHIDIKTKDHIVELESKQQKSDLLNLIKSVLPTMFKNKSSEMGKYYGIYKEEKLIAVAGERMKMNEFTEISSVVTHPKHTGNGHAKQLLKYLTDQIFNENKTPYLHAIESNLNAIKLYEKLGFRTRRKIDCWNLRQIN